MKRLMSHDYAIFGLRLRSTLELPELAAVPERGEPDILIEHGKIHDRPGAPGLVSAEGGLLLTVADVGRFLVSEGRCIRVEAADGVDPRNVRLFLLGSAFGVLLHQRGLLPLHANAVEIGGRAFAFMGPSGAGKSTLAAWFHDCGHPVLADDVCVVRIDGRHGAMAYPGLPRLRLWLDAIEISGRVASDFARSYGGAFSQLDKFDVPIDHAAMSQSPIPIGAIYVLATGARFKLTRLTGVEAVEAIFENTYRGGYLETTGTHSDHWFTAAALAQRTPVFRLQRSMELGRFSEEGNAILAHSAALARDKD
jgi:hypothetical protein